MNDLSSLRDGLYEVRDGIVYRLTASLLGSAPGFAELAPAESEVTVTPSVTAPVVVELEAQVSLDPAPTAPATRPMAASVFADIIDALDGVDDDEDFDEEEDFEEEDECEDGACDIDTTEFTDDEFVSFVSEVIGRPVEITPVTPAQRATRSASTRPASVSLSPEPLGSKASVVLTPSGSGNVVLTPSEQAGVVLTPTPTVRFQPQRRTPTLRV